MMLEIAKKSLPAELYNNLLENAKLVAKEYGFDFEETLQKLETKLRL